jgi:hypothetical protein
LRTVIDFSRKQAGEPEAQVRGPRRPATIRRGGEPRRASERRIEAAARAYWRELGDFPASEEAVAASVTALARAALSPAASEAELLRVARLTAVESAFIALTPPDSHGRFAGRRPDPCAGSPPRLAALSSGELGPDERGELVAHLETCLPCQAIGLKMNRADRAFATTVAGALTADETDGAAETDAPPARAARPATPSAAGGEHGLAWTADQLQWITRFVAAEHASAYPSEPESRRRSAGSECAATLGRLASDYAGQLRPDQRQELNAHLDGCLPCQATELRVLRAERAFATLIASGLAIDPTQSTRVIAHPAAAIDDVIAEEATHATDEDVSAEEPIAGEEATHPATDEDVSAEEPIAGEAATHPATDEDVSAEEPVAPAAPVAAALASAPRTAIPAAGGPFVPSERAVRRVRGAARGARGRRPRRNHGFSRREIVPAAAVAIVAVIAAIVLLGGGSSAVTPAASPAAPAGGAAVAPAGGAAAAPKAATAKTTHPAKPKHRTPAPVTRRARHKAAAPVQTTPTPSATAPAAAVVQTAPISAGSTPAASTPAPVSAPPAATSTPSTGSGTGSVSVTPTGGNLPPQTAPTQGIGTGG